MRILLFSIILACIVFPGIAQKAQTDSLQNLIDHYKQQDSTRLNLLNSLAYNYYTSDPDKGIAAAREAVELALKLDLQPKMAEAWRCMGINYWAKSAYDSALDVYNKALDIFKKENINKGIIQTYNNMGVVYQYMSDYPRALEFYLQSLAMGEKIDSKTAIANASTNIGLVYKNMENYPKALEFQQKGLAVFKMIDNKTGMAGCLGNIATVYDLMKQPAQALEYYRQALSINESIGSKRGISSDIVNMGIVFNNLKEYDSAYAYMSKAQSLLTEMGDKHNLAITLSNKASVISSASIDQLARWGIAPGKQFDEALTLHQQALQIFREIEAPDEAYLVLESMSETYAKKKDFANALSAYRDYVALRDSIVNDENKQELTRKELQFEFDKKEAVTNETYKAHLKQQQTEQYAIIGGAVLLLTGIVVSFILNKRKKDAVVKKHEAELKAEISDTEMKALRAQMNPHFIFNSLNSISDYMAKNDTQSAESYLSKFARLMRLTLENSELKEVALSEDLKALELYMQLESLRLKNKFTYSITIDEAIDRENTLVPPLLLQPFVENSIWHGIARKQGTGMIQIQIQKQGEMIYCVVEDDGVGRNASAGNTEIPVEKKSLGMKITRARIDILNRIKNSHASMAISDLAQGTRAELRLPLALSF